MRRDGALARLSSLTAAVGVAIIIAVGVFGFYVDKAFPGHQSHATTGSTSSTGSAAGSATGGVTAGGAGTSSAGSQGGLNPASTPTQSTSLPPPVVSGAS